MTLPVLPVAPFRAIRAHCLEHTIRVYQAYSAEIARVAVDAQTFKAPFRRGRMTWIKPSFAWMMYRAGWATKPGQERILAVDIRRDGFEWALAHSALSHFDRSLHSSREEWSELLRKSSVRVQWDPERTLTLDALPWRALQVGLEGEAVDAYLDHWIVGIEDVTGLAQRMGELIARHELEGAEAIRPVERPYPLPEDLGRRIGCRMEAG